MRPSRDGSRAASWPRRASRGQPVVEQTDGRSAWVCELAGTVLLQVLVDVDGRPLDVTIARSSGHRELDEAARLQVLKRWSFQPATRDDTPIQAVGLVPVEFNLRR